MRNKKGLGEFAEYRTNKASRKASKPEVLKFPCNPPVYAQS